MYLSSWGKKQQSISQSVGDPLFMVRGEKRFTYEFVRLLNIFSDASSMEIKWEKFRAYWFDKYTHKPKWLARYMTMGGGGRPFKTPWHTLWT